MSVFSAAAQDEDGDKIKELQERLQDALECIRKLSAERVRKTNETEVEEKTVLLERTSVLDKEAAKKTEVAADSAAYIHSLTVEREMLRAAVKRLHAAKGRYHTQIAACDLFDLVGLKNERPKK